MNIIFFIDLIGWIGAIAILSAYFLISNKKLEGDSFLYQALNMVGSVFLIINTFYYGAYPSTGVNVVWAFIAVFIITKKKK